MAQVPTHEDSLEGFSMDEMNHHLVHFKGTEEERNQRIERSKRAFIDRKYKLGFYSPNKYKLNNAANKNGNPNSVLTDPCSNIGFDLGTTAGWVLSGNTSSDGSGSTTGGDYLITSGAGTDPFGGYPVVYSGTNSLKLSSNNISTSTFASSATRVISVPYTVPVFFTFNFAMDILDYPHYLGDQATFIVNVYDAAGNLLSCPNYQCYHYIDASGNGYDVGHVPFQVTPGTPGISKNGPGGPTYAVTYSDWNTVTLDLSNYAGTNVTVEFICNWCIYNWDWAYCYIDADCPPSNTNQPPTCATLPFVLSGPTGMTTYSWITPAGNNPATASTYSINANVSGTYSLNFSLNTCNITTAYTYTYNVQLTPTADFTSSNTLCSGNFDFASTSTPSGGPPITGTIWEWGDGSANGSGTNATHSFPTPGTNSVTLLVTNGTCTDSITKTVVTPSKPVAGFNLVNNCLNKASNYTSTSTAAAGIASQIWNFGDISTGSGATPNHTYASAGTYTVTLLVTDNNSCKDSISESITVYPLPALVATSSTICVGQQTATLTASGALTYTWNPTTDLNPTNGSTVIGTPVTTTNYTVTGTDGNGCINTATSTITVNPLPPVAVNSSTICVGQQIASLTAANAVTYTWNPATTFSSNTGATVKGTPTITTSYTVAGTDANGCVNTANTTITVNQLPVITVNSSTICIGQGTATLTATNALTYTWNPSITLSSDTGTTVTGTPTLTTNYTVTGTDTNGCFNIATSTITVNPLPLITVNGSTICIGEQTATLTAHNATTYTWSPAATLNNNTGTTVTATPTTTTDYSITGTDANGCVNTVTTSVAVNGLPAHTASSNTPCVTEQNLNLTCNIPLGTYTYSWSGPNSFTSSIQNPILTFNNVTNAAAGTYSILVTDINGCYDTATVKVNLHQLPVITTTGTMVCIYQPYTITATGAGTNGVYVWTLPNNTQQSFSAPHQNITSTADSVGSFVYAIIGTDSNGCYKQGNIALLLVNRLPVINVNTDTICIGQETATLSASGANTYTWNPSASLSSSFGAAVTGTPNMNTIYSVTATDNNGCVNTTTTTIIVHQLPKVSTSSVEPGCAPLKATFNSSSTPNAKTYTWNFGNGQGFAQSILSPPSNLFTTLAYFPDAGFYNISLKVTDINNCVNTATTSALVYPLPVADFEYQPRSVSILAPMVQFFNQSSPTAIITNYNWDFGDIYSNYDTSTLVNPSHNYFNIGSYSVTLIVNTVNNCSATVVKPLIVNEGYVIYVPNAFTPNDDGINDVFKAVGEGIKTFNLYVFDRWGNNLFSSDDINIAWDGRFREKGTQIMKEDVYVWKIDLTDINNKTHSLHGTVTLIR